MRPPSSLKTLNFMAAFADDYKHEEPMPKQPTLLLEALGPYAISLFNAEFRYYPPLVDATSITILLSRVEAAIIARVASKKTGFGIDLTYHASEERMRAAIQTALTNHARIETPRGPVPLPPSTNLNKAAEESLEGTNLTQTAPTQPTSANTLIALDLRLDRAIARLDITHAELARRMKIGKTTYFAVKGGGGKQSTKLKVEQFLDKLDKSEPLTDQQKRTYPN